MRVPMSRRSAIGACRSKPEGSIVPHEACIADRIDGLASAAVLLAAILAAMPSPRTGELFLLSVTNPASFDCRYSGPVGTSAMIGMAHPFWLESRP